MTRWLAIIAAGALVIIAGSLSAIAYRSIRPVERWVYTAGGLFLNEQSGVVCRYRRGAPGDCARIDGRRPAAMTQPEVDSALTDSTGG